MKIKRRRSKGTGTLEKRGNVYFARWWDRDGKRHFETTRCTNRDDAERKLDEYVKADLILNENQKLEYVKAKIETNLGIVKKLKAHEIKLENILDKFFESNSLDATKGTRKSYHYEIKTLNDWLKKTHPKAEYIDDITVDIAKEFLLYKRSIVGNDTLNLTFSRLKRIWRCLDIEPIWSFYKSLKPSPQTRDTFSDKQISQIIPKLKVKGNRWYEFVMTIILTGMRQSDAKTLNISEIDISNKTITKRFKKNGVLKKLPLHPILVDILKTIEPDDDGYFFTHQKDINDCNKVFRTILKNLGIETSRKDENGKIKHVHSLHSLRHYFVSSMAKNGLSLQTCADFIGDKSKIIRKYYHTDIGVMRNQLTSIPQLNILSNYDEVLRKSEEEKEEEPIDAEIIDENETVSLPKGLLDEIRGLDKEKSIEENIRSLLTSLKTPDNIRSSC